MINRSMLPGEELSQGTARDLFEDVHPLLDLPGSPEEVANDTRTPRGNLWDIRKVTFLGVEGLLAREIPQVFLDMEERQKRYLESAWNSSENGEEEISELIAKMLNLTMKSSGNSDLSCPILFRTALEILFQKGRKVALEKGYPAEWFIEAFSLENPTNPCFLLKNLQSGEIKKGVHLLTIIKANPLSP